MDNDQGFKITISTGGGGTTEVTVRRPKRAEWRMYRQAILSDDLSKKVNAGEQLFMQCCVSPDKTGIVGLLDEYPAIVESVVPILSRLAGFDEKARADFD